MSFHALADFGVLGHDRYSAVRGHANESGGQEGGGWRLRPLGEDFCNRVGMESQEDATTGDGGDA
jgi:hypothetical protein